MTVTSGSAIRPSGSSSGARAASSTRSTSTTPSSRRWSAAAATSPARNSSSTSTTTARPTPSTRPTSTNISARSAGREFTAKDFRTWAGTVLAALALREFEAFDSNAQAKKNVVQAIENVAERLGNTPSVCRKCYIHPEIIGAYLDGSMLKTLQQRAEAEISEGLGKLRPEESAVVALLQQRLKQEVDEDA